MNKKIILFCSCILGISSFILVSCTDIDLTTISKDVKIQESLVMPIGETNLTVEDILNKLNLQQFISPTSNDIFYSTFDSAEFKFRLVDLVENSQISAKTYYPTPVTVTYPAFTNLPTVSSNEIINLGLNSNPTSLRIDSAKITSSTLTVEVNVNNMALNASDIKLSLIFPPYLDKTTNTIRMLSGSSNTLVVTPAPFGQVKNVPIPNFMMNTPDNATGIPVQIKIESKTGSSPVTMNSSSSIEVKLKFTLLDFAIAYGLFEPGSLATATVQQALNIKEFPSGLFKFNNPKIIVTASSNIGTYMRFQIDYMKAFVKEDPAVPAIFALFDGNQNKSEVFDVKPSAPGLWVTKHFTYDNGINGGTGRFFDNLPIPDMFEYKFAVQNDKTNNENHPLEPSFITPDGAIKVKVENQIALDLKAGSYFEMKDTIEDVGTNIRSTFNNVHLDKAFLMLTVLNGLPMKLIFSMTLKDSVGATIPSTLNDTEYEINAPEVDASGFVKATAPSGLTPQKLEISLTQGQLDDLKKAKIIEYTIHADGKDVNGTEKPIHFSKTNTFGVKLGIFVKGNMTTTLDSIK